MSIEALFNILLINKPSVLIRNNEKEIFRFIPELKQCKGFNQHSIWHPYDVYEHILHVVDNVDDSIELRLAALFHDIGKPETFELDKYGIGHFHGHWFTSKDIFEEFAEKHIPDAINVPNETISDEPIPELPKEDQLILVYCRSGNLSKQAAEKLVALGYTNVYEFGGIKDWTGETVGK